MQYGYRPRFLDDGTPCSREERGAVSHRVFVASIPKAGTYLVAELLSALNVQDSQLHVDEGWVSDLRQYRPGTHMWKYQLQLPTADALSLVLTGQFAVGHLPATGEYRDLLKDFRRVFVCRELRQVLVSWARFVFAEEMDGGVAATQACLEDGPERVRWVIDRPSSEWLLPNLRGMVKWCAERDTLRLTYENLVGDRGLGSQIQEIMALATHIDLPITRHKAELVARECVGRKTITWSGTRSSLTSHWDGRLEAWFREVGGPELNRALGYDDA